MRSDFDIRFLTSKNIPREERSDLAERLSDISESEPAMLGRPPEFYAQAIESNRLVVAVRESVHDIVGSGLLLPLSDEWAEISGVFVKPENRWLGIGNGIIEGVRELAGDQGFRLLLTMKPNVPGSEGMILEASKNGLVPVPYAFLRQFPEAFRNCCVCHDRDGSEDCPDRDAFCVLGVDALQPGAKSASIRFVESGEFRKAVAKNDVREKIAVRVKNTVWK